ncbi:MAG TPA: pyrimidine-nucleoside phosphorylase [Firmicutes bacterium]|nr:pyrimidine-nucleoside phosphorylase [Bacillota bacterium]
MRMVDLIQKKRDGYNLTAQEIHWMIQNYTQSKIPDYQMSAFAMAVFFQGMCDRESIDLTQAMIESGKQISLGQIQGIKVDKHSTGGVGDTTTLVLAPLVCACGAPVAKMSGRGLGYTGGTIDKLESVPGFHTELTNEQFIQLVNTNQIAIIGQSTELTPADKKLYSLRDVTATVDSIPLIASSIMSKKIAAGADAIVLDVKVGSGTFMKTVKDARSLARLMVAIGKGVGKDTVAILSDMSQPLGNAIGNALEVREAIATLQGKGPEDLRQLCFVLGAHMLILSKQANTIKEAEQMLAKAISSGKALEKFQQFISAQGGDASIVDHPEKLPVAKYVYGIRTKRSGYIHKILPESVGMAAMMLGAGRKTKQSLIDLSVGLVLQKKVGDFVSKGETWIQVFSQNSENPEIDALLSDSLLIDSSPIQKGNPFIYEFIQ